MTPGALPGGGEPVPRLPAAPLLLRLQGRRVVGVGGGAVAAGKLVPLARDHGADVHVIAPEAVSELTDVADWEAREYAGPGDLVGAALVVAATDDAHVNARVAADAEGLEVWCVRSDAADAGTAAIPATVRRGSLLLSVSTDGRSPTLSRWVREQLAQTYGPEFAALTDLLADLRVDPQITASLAARSDADRRQAWRSLPLVDILDLLRSGSVETAKEVAAACLSSFSD